MHKICRRAVFGKYTPIEPLDDADSTYLVTHLRRFPEAIKDISPQRAEKFVVDMLSDYLQCEVRPLGGVKDGGIDGYILKGDKLRTIIQVKWREDGRKAEAVSVVRELAGTLLAQGAPEGILVSNRRSFSKQAVQEAENISTRTESALGKIRLTLLKYQDILDMLEISSRYISDGIGIETLREWQDNRCDFDGAARLLERYYPGMIPINFLTV